MSKDYDRFLRISAWNFLQQQEIDALPVDPLLLLSKNGWEACTYSMLSQRTGKTIPVIRKKYHTGSFVFWSEKEERFVVCYDADLPAQEIRWLLMQEIAHIVLGHVSRTVPILSRAAQERRDLAKSEARGFTRRVLCPSIVLHDCKAFSVADIARLCGIPKRVAEYRSKHMQILEERGAFRTDPIEVDVERQFKDFILAQRKAKG